jgi:hypothetical protein
MRERRDIERDKKMKDGQDTVEEKAYGKWDKRERATKGGRKRWGTKTVGHTGVEIKKTDETKDKRKEEKERKEKERRTVR